MPNEITQEKMDEFLDDVIYTNFCTPEENITDNTLRQKHFSNVNTEDIKIVNEKSKNLSSSVIKISSDFNMWKRAVSNHICKHFMRCLDNESTKNYNFKSLIKIYSKKLANKVQSGTLQPTLLIDKLLQEQITKREMDSFLGWVVTANFCDPSKNYANTQLVKEYFPHVTSPIIIKDIERFMQSINTRIQPAGKSAIEKSVDVVDWNENFSKFITGRFATYLERETENYCFEEYIKDYPSYLKTTYALNKLHSTSLHIPSELVQKWVKIDKECTNKAQIATSSMLACWRYCCNAEKNAGDNITSELLKNNINELEKAIAEGKEVLDHCAKMKCHKSVSERLQEAISQTENYLNNSKKQLIANAKSENLKNNHDVDTKINISSKGTTH